MAQRSKPTAQHEYAILEKILGQERLAPYLRAAHGNFRSARELYFLDSSLSAALWRYIALFEVALRNSLDAACKRWLAATSFDTEWLLPDARLPLVLHKEVKGMAAKAMEGAQAAHRLRSDVSSRFGTIRNTYENDIVVADPPISHADLVSHTTLNDWKEHFFFRPPEFSDNGETKYFPDEVASQRRSLLYQQVTNGIFRTPLDPSVASHKIHRITLLRNRIGHHESLVHTDVIGIRKDLIFMLQRISPALLNYVTSNDSIPMLLRTRALLLRHD